MTKLNYSRKPTPDFKFPSKRKGITIRQSICLNKIRLKQKNNPKYKLTDWETSFMRSLRKQAERYSCI